MESSAYDDTFGVMPHRPDHPDFSELIQLVLEQDGRSTEGQEEMETQLARTVDSESASYVAMQRAIRIAGVSTRQELFEKRDLVTQLASVWIDGFLVGVSFRKSSTGEH